MQVFVFNVSKIILYIWFLIVIYFVNFFSGCLSDTVNISERPPKSARVVICGGGVVGTALLYQLAKIGLADQVVLLDKGK